MPATVTVALLSVIAVPLIQEWMGAVSQPKRGAFATAPKSNSGTSFSAEVDPAWNVTADSLRLLDQDFAEFEDSSKRVWEKLQTYKPP